MWELKTSFIHDLSLSICLSLSTYLDLDIYMWLSMFCCLSTSYRSSLCVSIFTIYLIFNFCPSVNPSIFRHRPTYRIIRFSLPLHLLFTVCIYLSNLHYCLSVYRFFAIFLSIIFPLSIQLSIYRIFITFISIIHCLYLSIESSVLSICLSIFRFFIDQFFHYLYIYFIFYFHLSIYIYLYFTIFRYLSIFRYLFFTIYPLSFYFSPSMYLSVYFFTIFTFYLFHYLESYSSENRIPYIPLHFVHHSDCSRVREGRVPRHLQLVPPRLGQSQRR